MFGIDTNILVRLFAPSDHPKQAEAAREFILANAPVFVSPVVLAEFAWTLRSSFRLGHDAISALLSRIAAAPEFIFAHPEAIERAVQQYQSGAADFADYLIGELNLSAGCKITMTFDQAAAKTSAFNLLKI